jgi:hypothetical protein
VRTTGACGDGTVRTVPVYVAGRG